MSGESFVISDGLDVQQQAMLRIPLIDVDAARARAVGGSVSIVGWNCIFGTCRFHWNDRQLALREMSEELGQFGLHLTAVVVVQVEELLTRLGVEAVLSLDVLVQACQIFEAKFVRDHEHLSFGFGNLPESQFMDLVGSPVRGCDAPDGKAVARRSVRKRPDPWIRAALWRVFVTGEGCEALIGGNDLLADH